MPLGTLLIVGGGWVLILVLTLWRVATWKRRGDE